MADARARGWGWPGPPGSAEDRAYQSAHIVTITAGGIRLRVRREVAHLFKAFCDEIVARGYPLNGVADDWGFCNRDIRGRPGVKSNHAWGLAVDLNATTNPMGATLRTDMPNWVIDCARKWGFFWGGNYLTRPDAMHFEFLGRPSDVAKYPIGGQEQDMPLNDDDKAAIRQIVQEELRGIPLFYESLKQEIDREGDEVVGDVRILRDNLAARVSREIEAAVAKIVDSLKTQ